MSREQFHKWLRNWYSTSMDKRISHDEKYGQAPYLYIQEEGNFFRLNVDTKRVGVEAYLELLDADEDLAWVIVPNKKMKLNKVAFGEDKKILKGFYLYIII